MALLPFSLILMLHFGGVRGQSRHHYSSVGGNVILPCSDGFSFPPGCPSPSVTWLYIAGPNQPTLRVPSARPERMRTNSFCTLHIINVTAEDVGLYICQQSGRLELRFPLNVMTVEPSPPDAGLDQDGNLTLRCFLRRPFNSAPCGTTSLQWLDERGRTLRPLTISQRFSSNVVCASFLRLQLQPPRNATITCFFVEDNGVKVRASYQLLLPATTEPPPESPPCEETCIIVALAGALLLLMVIIAAFIITFWRSNKIKTKDLPQTVNTCDEPEDGVVYADLVYDNQRGSLRTKAACEECVTYSAIRTSAAQPCDASSLYGNVSRDARGGDKPLPTA